MSPIPDREKTLGGWRHLYPGFNECRRQVKTKAWFPAARHGWRLSLVKTVTQKITKRSILHDVELTNGLRMNNMNFLTKNPLLEYSSYYIILCKHMKE